MAALIYAQFNEVTAPHAQTNSQWGGQTKTVMHIYRRNTCDG